MIKIDLHRFKFHLLGRTYQTLSAFLLVIFFQSHTFANGTIPTEPIPNSNTLKTINYGYISIPPYSYINEDNIVVGRHVNLARKMIEHLDYKLQPMLLPRIRLDKALNEGVMHFWFGAKGSRRQWNNIHFSTKPVDRLKINLYSTKTTKTQDIEKISGKTIVLIRGYHYNNLVNTIRSNNKIIYVNDHSQGIKVLYGRNADFFVGYEESVEWFFEQSNVQKTLYSQHLGSVDIYIKMNKILTNHLKMMSTIESNLPFLFIKDKEPLE